MGSGVVSMRQRMTSRSRIAAILTSVLSMMLLSGCASQLDALAPVGGDDVSMVRTVTTTVLLHEQLEIMNAPQCTKTDTEITCEGELLDGSAVSAEAPTTPFGEITVTVAGELLYQGDISSVLEAAAEGELP